MDSLAWDVLYQLAYYFPWYVALVLIPMFIRIIIERAVGIRPEEFEGRADLAVAYETAFRAFVLTVLYYPFFEELLFRGLPYFFFGTPGVALGSFVWVVMHPAWQLQYLSSEPTRKKLVFTVTSTSYYVTNAIFYSMMWVDGAGLTAILYHVIHNGWLTLADMAKEVELPTPWRRFRYVRKPGAPSAGVKLFRKFKKPEVKPAEEEGSREEAGGKEQLKFVVRKSRKSLAEEAEEAREYAFVRKKVKNEE